MTDFDCSHSTCESPTECLQGDVCLSAPERNQLARNDRVKQIIDATRERLREAK